MSDKLDYSSSLPDSFSFSKEQEKEKISRDFETRENFRDIL